MDDVVNTGVQDIGERAASQSSGGLVPIAGWVAAVVLALFAVLALLHETRGVDVRVLLRDPAETANIPEYAGAYMYAGVLLLWTAGIVSVMVGLLLRVRRPDATTWRYFAGLGVFLCWLAADDLFMIHEWLGLALSRSIGIENEYLGRTRLEGLVFLSYGVIALVGLLRYRSEVRRTDPGILLAAIGCFALSAGVDIAGSVLDGAFTPGQAAETTRAYAEDMLKFAGILFMVVYVARSAQVLLAPNLITQSHDGLG